MEIKIIEQKDKPVLSRKEIIAEISFTGKTPSNEEVRKKIAEESKADEELVVVKNIYTEFGLTKAKVNAYVYNSKEKLESIEPKKKEKTKPGQQAETKAEEPKQEEKGEKKTEEKSE
jgi:small subunit ribosomal protein S24e